MILPNYCVPLGRPLTAAEHADHLDAHAQLARHLAATDPHPGARPYHEATAETMEFAARIVRAITEHGAGLCDLIALAGTDNHAFTCASRRNGAEGGHLQCSCDYKPINTAGRETHALIKSLDGVNAEAAHAPAGGVQRIAEERARQRSKEGYSDAHDDVHGNFEMTRSAVAYALHATGRLDADQHWPFGSCEWKPSAGDPVRDLTKAGALIAAEIDRLQRLAGGRR
jgi:hypothetical protein